MNKDAIAGSLRYGKGSIEKAVGDITGSAEWQVDGIVDKVAGGAQKLYGNARETVGDIVDDAPDALARAGDKVRDVAGRTREIANDRVSENPVLWAALAGTAAYALAWVIHGRRG